MAKGTRRFLASARSSHLYNNVYELPWDRIETTAGKAFSKNERQEIYECTQAYSHELNWQESGAPSAQLEELRKKLVLNAKGICEIAERYLPLGGGEVDEIDGKVIEALTVMYSDKGFFLRDELHKTALAAQRLVAGLIRAAAVEVEVTNKLPGASALSAFVAAVLLNAKGEPARKEPGWKMNPAKEYSRWSISVGPNAAKFRKFTNAVLNPDQDAPGYSEDQIKEAFKRAKEEGAASYEDIYDRIVDRGNKI